MLAQTGPVGVTRMGQLLLALGLPQAVTEQEAMAFKAARERNQPVAQRFLRDLRLMPTWRQRLRYAWINMFPSPAYMNERYGFSGAARLPFYYVYRVYVGMRR